MKKEKNALLMAIIFIILYIASMLQNTILAIIGIILMLIIAISIILPIETWHIPRKKRL